MSGRNVYINTKIKRTHGSGVSPSEGIDFSYGINPYTFDFASKIDFASIPINQYPDHSSNDFKEKLSSIYELDSNNIFVGNGSAEIIFLLFFVFVREGDYVSGLWPSYGDYQYYTEVSKANFHRIEVSPPDFELDSKKVTEEVNQNKSKIFFLCNPTNPTGKYYSEEFVKSLLDNINSETLIVLDEAYLHFTKYKWDSIKLLNKYSNLLIMRSMTKDYGITAFRLGYLLGDLRIMKALDVSAPSWHVNAIAQQAGILALEQQIFLDDTTNIIYEEKERLTKELTSIGYEVLHSDINSFLLKVKDAGEASILLKDNGILVRDCTSYDLPQYLRISVQKPEENNQLLKVLKKLYKQLC